MGNKRLVWPMLVACIAGFATAVFANGYDVRNAIVALAREQDGKSYVWGTAGPDTFDCSGLVMYCYNQNGVSVDTHSVSGQWGMCDQLGGVGDLLPGDLVFYGGLSHVGIWTGSNSVFAADSEIYGIHEHYWGWDKLYTKFGRIRASYWPGGDNSYNPCIPADVWWTYTPAENRWYRNNECLSYGISGSDVNVQSSSLCVADGGPGSKDLWVRAWNACRDETIHWYGGYDNQAPDLGWNGDTAPGGTWLRGTQHARWHWSDGLSGIKGGWYAWNGGAHSDGGSGVAQLPEGKNTLQIYVEDNAWSGGSQSGNSSTISAEFWLDNAAPTIAPSGPATSTWLNTPQNFSWAVADPNGSNGSGLATGYPTLQWDSGGQTPVAASGTAQIQEGKHVATIRANDAAGNAATPSTAGPFWIDTVAPIVTLTLNPAAPNGENGWYTVNPTLAISAVDPNGPNGSGVQDRFYSIDGSEQPYTGEITISDGGVHSVAGRATDVAGNSGQVALEVKVDTTAPVFASIDTASESGCLDTLTASWTCTDAESGAASYEYSIYREAGDTDELIAGPVTTDQPYAFQQNLSLIRGETYYFVVRAKNNAGLYSGLIASQGITATDGTRDAAPSMNSGGISVPAEARASANYMLVDSVGQFVVDTSASGGIVLESGYWHSEVTTTPVETVAIAKATENDKLIQLGSPDKPVVVTVAPGIFADRFYVEQPDRTSGIAVSFGTGLTSSLTPGDRVWILGTLNTVDGERIVQGVAPTWVSRDLPLGALFVSNGWLGGSDLNLLTIGIHGAAGLNNLGLLVKTCGRVGKIDPAGAYFYISDGTNISDGTTTDGEANVGVRVAGDGRSYTPGQFVAVTGISSCFIDEGGRSRRLIRPVLVAPLQ